MVLNCQEVVKAHMYGDELNKVVYSEPPTIKVDEKLWPNVKHVATSQQQGNNVWRQSWMFSSGETMPSS